MATAIAHPNIALVKYWGKRDIRLNLPSTGSISLCLAPMHTRTTVTWGAERDEASIDGRPATPGAAQRIFRHLDRIDPWRPPARVESRSDFPASAGLASSASAFAALTLAACAAAGQKRSQDELSILARQGSGSACRSIPGGWVEWEHGSALDGTDSLGRQLAPPGHWDLRMVVAIFDSGRKAIGSTEGMLRTMGTSPMYAAWVASAPADILAARAAILSRDLAALGRVMERSALKMHATMMSAAPPIRYWRSGSVWAMDAVESMRREGLSAWWTMDAGPNVKVLCPAREAPAVARRMSRVAERVQILEPAGGAHLVEEAP